MKAQSNWIFSPEEVRFSPSVLAGQSRRMEIQLRMRAVWRLVELKETLRAPQLTVLTAAVFLHRYFMRKPIAESAKKLNELAAAAFFLASKVEECTMTIALVALAVHDIDQSIANTIERWQARGSTPATQQTLESPELEEFRKKILSHEESLLRELTFDLDLVHPHTSFFDTCERLKSWNDTLKTEYPNMVTIGMFILNDSAYTTACLLYTPEEIAASVLVMTFAQLGLELPSRQTTINVTPPEEGEEMIETDTTTYWLEYFDANKEKIIACIGTLGSLYENIADDFVKQESDKLLREALRLAQTIPNSDIAK